MSTFINRIMVSLAVSGNESTTGFLFNVVQMLKLTSDKKPQLNYGSRPCIHSLSMTNMRKNTVKCLGGVSLKLFSAMSDFSSCLLRTCLLVVGQREVRKALPLGKCKINLVS